MGGMRPVSGGYDSGGFAAATRDERFAAPASSGVVITASGKGVRGMPAAHRPLVPLGAQRTVNPWPKLAFRPTRKNR